MLSELVQIKHLAAQAEILSSEAADTTTDFLG